MISSYPLKICLLTLEWPPYGCGIGTYMYNLARGLNLAGHHVTVITHDHNPAGIQGVNLIKVPVFDFKSSLWLRIQKWRMEPFHSWSKHAYEAFRSCISEGKVYDLVETAEYGAWGRYFIGGSTPLVVRCHNSTRLLMASSDGAKLPFWLKVQDRRERSLATRADGLACPSNALANWLRDIWRIPLAKIQVIPNPIDDDLFRPSISRMSNSNEILFVGRLEQKKGVYDFADAVGPLLERYPNLKIRYVGFDMPAPNELTSLGTTASQVIKSRLPESVHNRIVFMGHIPVGEIIRYWQDALCAVVPSRMLESFSYTVLEAMACGCPVIASRKGGPSEIISDGSDGLLVAPGDVQGLRAAINKLIEDPLLRECLSRNARKTVTSRYGIDVVTKTITEHYRRVIDCKNMHHGHSA